MFMAVDGKRLEHETAQGLPTVGLYGGVLKWGHPKLDGLQGKTLLK